MNEFKSSVKHLNWRVGYCKTEHGLPNAYYPSTVPGAVQIDYANAHGWKPYWQEKDPSIYEWMEDVYWVYCTELTVPRECSDKGMGAVLVFKGIDYKYRITVDSEMLHEGEGMFSEIRLDVAKYAGKTTRLEVRLYPIPKADIVFEGRDQAKESCKPGVSYGWDFHPRLVPTGLWDEVFLEIGGPGILDLNIYPITHKDLKRAGVDIEVTLAQNAELCFELLSPQGIKVSSENFIISGRKSVSIDVENPELWWPAGYGTQSLYTLKIYSAMEDKCLFEKRFGFRHIALNMNEGEWDYPNEFPKSRSSTPITLTINGKRIFAKGSNWVPPDIFFGAITDKMYQQQLELVAAANMNILRVWGGGIINKDAFFENCNRLGIMVWQEFPLACNEYPDKPEYLRVLEKEATSIIKKLRSHPSLVMWCGGNELFNAWSRMTDQHHALRLLGALCYKYDRFTPFLMTSPLTGMAHGHYRHLDSPNEEFLTKMIRQKNTAYTEFGVPGCNTLEYILKYCDPQEFYACKSIDDLEKLLPFQAKPVMKKLSRNAILHYYGKEGDPTQTVEQLGFLQGMVYKGLFEEMRRQSPRCSMAINWCFNAPWPLLCSENIVDWPCHPKPAYQEIKQALRGQLVSLRIEKQMYLDNENFRGELWLLNDTLEDIPPTQIEVFVKYENSCERIMLWDAKVTNSQSNQKGPSVLWQLPIRRNKDYFIVELRSKENPKLDSLYRFTLRHHAEFQRIITLNDL